MKTFKTVAWDKDTIADAACKQLLTKSSINTPIYKKKEKSKNSVANKKKKAKIRKGAMDKGTKNLLNDVTSEKNNPKVSFGNKNINKNHLKHKIHNIAAKKKNKSNSAQTSEYKNQTVSDNNEYNKKQKHKKRKNKRSPTTNNEHLEAESTVESNNQIHPKSNQQKKKKNAEEKLKQVVSNPRGTLSTKKSNRGLSLRERMLNRLKAARFRYLNQQIYTNDGSEAQNIFNEDPSAFEAYHEGYRQQVSFWPLNPLDVIIKSIQQMPKTHVIADFGCGEAKLAKSVKQKVHSFDLVAVNESVTACNMARVPLENNSIDVAVFCLSLMGTNLHEYLLEANRVLKIGGVLKIAEVESRFEDVDNFIANLKQFKFKNTWKDLSHNLFYFLDFKKEANIKNKKKLPAINLNPCLYKKR